MTWLDLVFFITWQDLTLSNFLPPLHCILCTVKCQHIMRKRHLGDSKPPLKHASAVNPAGEWYSDVKYNIIAYMKLFPIFHLLHFIFTMIMPVISHQAIFVRNRFVRRAEKIWNWRKVAQNRLVMFYGVWFRNLNCGPNKTFKHKWYMYTYITHHLAMYIIQ